MSDSDKTKQELIAEIEALRAKLGESAGDANPEPAEPKGGLTRRDVLASAWVAPVILTVPIGAAVAPRRAQAQPGTGSPTAPPSTIPTSAPTTIPTSAPTTIPTSPPTSPPPTSIPTMMPTSAPTSVPATPMPPTAFPTAAAEPIPVEISEFDIS